MSVELVDCLSDDDNNTSMEITGHNLSQAVKFVPLDDESRCVAALKFNLVIRAKSTDLKYSGIGNACRLPPIIKNPSCEEGACLFNSISILMMGTETYSAIICNVVCNYISNPVNYSGLQMYIPPRYKKENT